MHHTCVEPASDGSLHCPVCKVESSLSKVRQEELDEDRDTTRERPFWHEAEVGASAGRRHKPSSTNRSEWKSARASPRPEMRGPSFPELRWPALEEAQLYGYATLKDWNVDDRRRELDGRNGMVAPANQSEATNLLQYAAEFVQLEKRHSANKQDDEE